MSRDMQRKRLYRAEVAAVNVLELERGVEHGWGSAPLSPAECQRYVNKVTRSVWTRKRFKTVTITVEHHDMAKRGRGCATGRYIWTAGRNPHSMTKMYLLHEIAHVLDPGVPGHSATFCEVYLALVQHFLGKQQADVLKKQMLALKLRVKPKAVRAKRVLSEDQKEALRDRLAKARQVKEAKAAIRKAEQEIAGLIPWLRTYRDSKNNTIDPTRRDDLEEKIALVERRIHALHTKIGNVKYALAKDRIPS